MVVRSVAALAVLLSCGVVASQEESATQLSRTVYITITDHNGGPVGDLPIERPTRFRLVVNAKTAGTLGIDLPTSLLLRADEVIE